MARKALVVGINAYPGAPLSGCVNDASNMANLLMRQYGFASSDICILTDKQATTANILAKLDWLVSGLNAGDQIVFHYSGHGAQVPTGDKSEPDGLSECICPVDFDWSPAHMIIDKQFVQIFSRIPAGVVFNWASDSCHSGDLDREMPRSRVSMDRANIFYPLACFFDKLCFWRKPKFDKHKTMPVPVGMKLRIAHAMGKGHKTKGMVGGLLDVGFVSGCTSKQTSADTSVNGTPCGALTWYLVKHLQSTPNLPLTQLVANLDAELARNGYDQQPQAEGARKSRPWLVA